MIYPSVGNGDDDQLKVVFNKPLGQMTIDARADWSK